VFPQEDFVLFWKPSLFRDRWGELADPSFSALPPNARRHQGGNPIAGFHPPLGHRVAELFVFYWRPFLLLKTRQECRGRKHRKWLFVILNF
jgi:hypothetical protein